MPLHPTHPRCVHLLDQLEAAQLEAEAAMARNDQIARARHAHEYHRLMDVLTPLLGYDPREVFS